MDKSTLITQACGLYKRANNLLRTQTPELIEVYTLASNYALMAEHQGTSLDYLDHWMHYGASLNRKIDELKINLSETPQVAALVIVWRLSTFVDPCVFVAKGNIHAP